MATHSSILAWRIPWTEEPGGLRSMGSQRVGHELKRLTLLFTCTIALVSQARKVMLKTLQVRLQQYMNRKFQMFKLGLEKPEEPEIKSPTSTGSLKKQENSRKTCTSDSWTMLKPLTVWITTNCGKFFKRCEYQTTLPAS